MAKWVYPDRGVTVIIPDQASGAKYKVTTQKNYDPDTKFKQKKVTLGDPESFELLRVVINFAVKDASGSKGPVKFKFKPKMELYVDVTPADLAHATPTRPLKLAWWDADKKAKRWVVLKDAALDPLKKYFKVEIEEWGDPGLGIGR
jgi:hypothetical protein